jgi:KTSC domain-containing protein
MIRNAAALLALLWTSPLTSETVDVRDRGTVDLATFACTDTPRSTVVQRVCYDATRHHLLVNAAGSYSEYCRLPAATFEAFVVAPSMGQFYRQRIATAPFACDGARTN